MEDVMLERVKVFNYFKIWIFFFLLFFPTLVEADICSDEEVSRLKVLADRVSVHYEYLDSSDETLDWGNTIPYGYNYEITVLGMNDGLVIASDDDDDQEFDYLDSIDGNITFYVQNGSGSLSLKVFSRDCSTSLALRTMTLSLPVLNDYYYTVECEAIRDKKINLEVCNRTVPKDFKINNTEFYDIVGKYLNPEKKSANNLMKFFSDCFSNFYLILGIIIVTVVVIFCGIRLFMKRRRLE